MSYSRSGTAAPPPPVPTRAAAAAPVQSYYSAQPSAPAPVALAPVAPTSDWYTPAGASSQQVPQQQQQEPYTGMNSGNNAYASSYSDQQQPQLQHSQQQEHNQQSIWNPAAATSNTNGLEGSMNTNSTMMPSAPTSGGVHGTTLYDPNEFSDEPPLLEELGINISHIYLKTKAVLLPFSRFHKSSELMQAQTIVQDADLVGPLTFALLLGGELLLTAKIQFGYIYGFGLFGCLAMTLILNLVSPNDPISIWTVTSILGYSLLPVNMLAALKVVSLGYLDYFGRILALLTIAWSTKAATRLLEEGCGMRDQRYLVAYPIALVYSAFVMITIF